MTWNNIMEFIRSYPQTMWISQLFLIVLITAVVNYFKNRVYLRLIKKLETTKSIWDGALANAIQHPLTWLIWLFGLTYSLDLSSIYVEDYAIFDWTPTLRRGGALALCAWSLIRFVNRAEANYLDSELAKNSVVDITTAHAIAQILKISIVITTGLVVLPLFGINTTGILAFGGAGSLIVGFAAKDLLANFFGALMIYLDRPFAVGDWIRSPDRNVEGTVEYIGWRLTRIRTFDRRPLYVPNAVFASVSVENPSRMSNRRIKEVVGIRYQDADKVEIITSEIKAMLLAHEDIDATKPCFVNLNAFGLSSLDIQIYVFTKTTQWIPYQITKQELMMNVLNIIAKHGAQVPFPTRTLNMPDQLANLSDALPPPK